MAGILEWGLVAVGIVGSAWGLSRGKRLLLILSLAAGLIGLYLVVLDLP